jgi:hypothetical protein
MWPAGLGWRGRRCIVGCAAMRILGCRGWWISLRSRIAVRIRGRLGLRCGWWRCGGRIRIGGPRTIRYHLEQKGFVPVPSRSGIHAVTATWALLSTLLPQRIRGQGVDGVHTAAPLDIRHSWPPASLGLQFARNDVHVEAISEAEPGVEYPVCLAGRRACPPQDCGGPGGTPSC